MLGGERQVARVDDIAPKPGYGQTASAAFSKPIEQVQQLADYVFPGLSSEKTRREGAERLATINETLNDPRQGFGQQTVNTISGIVGGLLPTAPLAFAGGAIGAGVAGVIGFGARELALDIASEHALARYLSTQVPISKLVPEAVSHFVPNASIGAIAAGATEAYTAYKGFVIPEHFAEHYNAVENSLDVSHAIQDWGSDNYGFLLGGAPLAAGYIAYKGIGGVISRRNAAATGRAAEAELTRLHAEHEAVLKENQIKEGETAAREAKVSELQNHLQQAEDEGFITHEMHSWYLDYLENPNDNIKKITLYRGHHKNEEHGIWWTKNLKQAKSYAKKEGHIISKVYISPEELTKHFETHDENTFNEHYSFGGTKEEFNKITQNNERNIHERGLKILQDLQIPYDRVTGRVWNQVLSPEGVKNVQSAMFDQHITGFSEEENQLLSSYVIHNELDGYIANMRENPNLIHAINGMTHNLGLKIEAHSQALKEFDYALSRKLPEGLLKRQILSQNNIYQNLKKFQEQKPNGKAVRRSEIPHHVPKEVALKLNLAHQIKLIETKKTTKYQRMFDKGEHLVLKEMLKAIKLMHPADELLHIKDTLLPEGKLIGDFKNRSAYHRLEDLSQVWPNAKVLLDRIHMEAINVKQQGLNAVLKKFMDMVDSNSALLANPDNVKRYLSTRIEKSVPGAREFESTGIKYQDVVAEQKAALNESMKPDVLYNEASVQKVTTSEYKEAAVHFEESVRRYKQFTENEKALAELITCALGE